MKFSGKMCFEIMLNVTKNQVFTLSLEDIFFEKPQGGQFDLLPGRLRLNHINYSLIIQKLYMTLLIHKQKEEFLQLLITRDKFLFTALFVLIG